MKKIYITFSGSAWNETTKIIVERAPLLGADEVIVYDDDWLLQQAFYYQNRWLWDHSYKRGFGWYAWKPYIIHQALKNVSLFDIVLYTDADCIPIAPLDVLYEHCAVTDGMMLFASENHSQRQWCKRDCYIVMGQDEEKYYDVQAGVARFMLFQKGAWRAEQFLMEWLTYCVNPLANTFDTSVLKPELPGFIEHRAEQAIMTNLAHKHGLNLYREACQAGNGIYRDRGLYGQLFEQRNREDKTTIEALGSAFRNV